MNRLMAHSPRTPRLLTLARMSALTVVAALVAMACTAIEQPVTSPSADPSPTDVALAETATYPEPQGILGAPGETSEPNADLAPKGVDVSTLLDPPAPAALDDPSRPVDPKAGIMNLDHLVFIVLENRSFDHYFGTFPGADGIPMDANGNPTVCLARPGPARRVPHARTTTRTSSIRAARTASSTPRSSTQRREDGRVRRGALRRSATAA